MMQGQQQQQQQQQQEQQQASQTARDYIALLTGAGQALRASPAPALPADLTGCALIRPSSTKLNTLRAHPECLPWT